MRLLLGQICEIQAGTSEKIFRLSDVHPIPLQIKGVQLPIGGHLWKDFFLNRSRSKRDPFKNVCVEDVNPSVDTIRDKLDRFLHEAFNLGGLGFHHHDAILGRFFDLCDNNCSFFSM
jgi:hypothetical protein